MRKGLAFVVVGLFGCSPTGPSSADEKPAVSPSQPELEPEPDNATPEPEPEAAETAIVVLMTAATLADDCGGGPNTRPEPSTKTKAKTKAKTEMEPKRRAKSDSARRCEQSSIQLSVTSPKDAASAKLVVKSVELLLASGKSLGMLQTRAPSVWSDPDGYAPWDENVEPGQEIAVTYALTQPDWSQVSSRWNQTYTVKAVVSIAGSDQNVEQSVVVDAPTSLPPNVKT